MRPLGLYLHIPFCLSKCRYCDFCSLPHPKKENVAAYISKINNEICEYGELYREYNINTVYFGGGTPTLLKASELTSLLFTVKESFRLSNDAEITAECNPATADKKYFEEMLGAGFNRLSIGVQSMVDRELKLLGRLHSAEDAKKAVVDAKDAGFKNLSVDVMFGIPEQTRESLSYTIDRLAELNPNHFSLYGLKIEDGTHFARHRGELALPDEDTECEMFNDSAKKLSSLGYDRYEISNFAKDGFESRHNLKYWKREDYLGIGAAAHSCVGNRRFFATSDVNAYLSGKSVEGEEILSPHDILCEKIMLGMRLSRGVDFNALEKEHGSVVKVYENGLEKYISGGFVVKKDGALAFTDKGAYVSNYILSDILDFEEKN